MGSSPRVRGKPTHTLTQRVNARLIPACAGKTSSKSAVLPIRRAHPRVCGENTLENLEKRGVHGSSPRVRGKRQLASQRPCFRGLIPACAGKTFSGEDFTGGKRAHPRVCGENGRGAPPQLHKAGSSPRVRGKQKGSTFDFEWNGLIPACAGKTRTRPCGHAAMPAHPRVCGENPHAGYTSIHVLGSSPRVRGKLAAVLAR